MNPYYMMLFCYVLSIIHFLIGYREALKISGADGLVDGTVMISCIPLGVVFAFFSHFFWKMTI
ncbi:hypothetical protein ACH95_21300 [Bacillus glycinifermentans]|uniref:Uncharacterized protein n=1 Tax=Bacillus glycinifermentans TaxID=1664069 RepID=A0A0J6E8L3_9BACI|nr:MULTISPECIES: hypothetical protein [Bacillus]ATH92907.1 hypothetical protein COP00_10090 [Bacillus glycinifermentans]KKB72227.1 hypothetical protein TH62_18660 [Bacillus sp. TH008]KMM53710.1 hypothetical protein ACH95_21300 [Bacillus glycinifermentans]KRT94120.1 hypothetical protein AB447_202165 [Bacillus glycinifermentans]MBU8788529.1 hypothetical protein [Bacillus glycinifermentans]